MAVLLRSEGRCPTCDRQVVFKATHPWLRDHYLCSGCGSIPRERALMACIERYYPGWRDFDIFECSPGPRGASRKLQRGCPGYVSAHYYPGMALGARHPSGHLNQDLERLTFPDASFDLVVTQDVFEHLFDPARAFAEVARVLRPGGAHIFSVPLVNKHRPTALRARRNAGGEIEHLAPPEYHGNPIDDAGSLVTYHWGYDICEHIHKASGLFTTMVVLDDLSIGVRADLIEILVTTKR